MPETYTDYPPQCPYCQGAVEYDPARPADEFPCPHCAALITGFEVRAFARGRAFESAEHFRGCLVVNDHPQFRTARCGDCRHFAEQTRQPDGTPECDMDDPDCLADHRCFVEKEAPS